MIDRYKLALAFDPAGLQADLDRLWDRPWIAHFNTDYYQGGWSGVPLRHAAGQANTLYPGGDVSQTVEAPVLAQAPYLRSVIAAFACETAAVRLLRLDPGARIREHRDYDLGPELGLVRVHIPIRTNPEVAFIVRNRRVVMAPGEVWYLDLGQPHRVFNGGTEPRVHLVLDLVVNDWVRRQIPFDAPSQASAAPVPFDAQPDPLAMAALEAFRDQVRHDPALQRDLRDIEDRVLFAEETVRLAAEAGHRFTTVEVAAAVRAAQSQWNAG